MLCSNDVSEEDILGLVEYEVSNKLLKGYGDNKARSSKSPAAAAAGTGQQGGGQYAQVRPILGGSTASHSSLTINTVRTYYTGGLHVWHQRISHNHHCNPLANRQCSRCTSIADLALGWSAPAHTAAQDDEPFDATEAGVLTDDDVNKLAAEFGIGVGKGSSYPYTLLQNYEAMNREEVNSR